MLLLAMCKSEKVSIFLLATSGSHVYLKSYAYIFFFVVLKGMGEFVCLDFRVLLFYILFSFAKELVQNHIMPQK